MMKKEFYTYVLPQSIHTTLHNLNTYAPEALQSSKSLQAVEGSNKNASLSSSPPHFLYERKNSFPFPQPGILIQSWILARSLPPYLAGVDHFCSSFCAEMAWHHLQLTAAPGRRLCCSQRRYRGEGERMAKV